MLLAVVQTWREGNQPTDASLMERVLQRDSGALETLYDRYARPVYSLVLRISQQPASAEEIVQDVFLQLWRNAKHYQATRGPLGTVKNWIRGGLLRLRESLEEARS